MAQEECVSRAVMASATPLPQTAGTTLHWDARSGVCREMGPPTGSGPGQRSSFQAMGQPVTGTAPDHIGRRVRSASIPSLSPQAIEWEQEAALVTFDLDPVLLTETAHEVIPGATGELVWVQWQETAESCTPAVRPMLMMHARTIA